MILALNNAAVGLSTYVFAVPLAILALPKSGVRSSRAGQDIQSQMAIDGRMREIDRAVFCSLLRKRTLAKFLRVRNSHLGETAGGIT